MIKSFTYRMEPLIKVEITNKDIINYIEQCTSIEELTDFKFKIYSTIHNLKQYGVPYIPDDDDFRSRA